MALTRPTADMLNTSVEFFSDPIITLHAGVASSNVDIGFVMNRADGLVSNTAFYWSESSNSFVAAFTANSGFDANQYGNIAVSSYANLAVGNLNAISGINASTVYVQNGIFWKGNGNPYSSGGASITGLTSYSGNSSIVDFYTTESTSTTTGALQVVGGVGIGGNLYVGGNLIIAGNTTTVNYETITYTETANVINANSVTTGGLVVNSTTGGYFATLSSIAAPVYGGSQTWQFYSKNSLGGGPGSWINFPDNTNQYTAYPGSSTGLSLSSLTATSSLIVGSSGITSLQNTQNNDGVQYNSGALQVAGGAGFGSNVYIGGNLVVVGNIFSTVGNINSVTITGNNAQFIGNAAGFGGLYAGISAGFIYQPQTIIQASANFNGYAQINAQNINSGNQASSDYVATADNGSANDTYIDMGIASSTYNYPGFGILKPNDGYLLVQGNTITGGGNLVLTSGLNDIVFSPGGSNANNEYGRITASNVFVIKSSVDSTSTTTGALQVQGGVGVQGNVYSNAVYTDGLYWAANGQVITTGGGSTITGVTGYSSNSTVVVGYTTATTSPTTGALQVDGGLGVQGDIQSGGKVVVTTGIFWAGNGNPYTSTGSGGGSSLNYTAATTPPGSGNNVGDQWYNTSTDTLYEYAFDGTSSYWVDVITPTLNAPGANIGNLYPVISGATFFNSNLVPMNSGYTIGTSSQAVTGVYATTVQTANLITSGLFYPNGTPITSNSINYTTSSTAPTSGNKLGDVWYNTATDTIFEYTNDGVGTYWVDISSPPLYSTGAGSGNIASIANGNNYVGANLIPVAANTFSLGTPAQTYTNLYLSGMANIGGANIVVDSVTGAVAVIPLPTTLNPNPSAVVVTPIGQVTSVVTTAGIVSTAAIGNAANLVCTSTGFSNITLVATTPSTSTTTGALINYGGIGTAGNINAGATIVAAGGIQNTPIGNATPNTGNFTTLSATTASFTTLSATAITCTPYTSGSIDNTPIGSSSASTGTFTNLTVNGNLTIAGTFAIPPLTQPTLATASPTYPGYLGVPVNSQNGNYTVQIGDSGSQIYMTANANITIPSNATVPFPVGTVLSFSVAPNITSNILIVSDSMFLTGFGLSGTRLLTNYGMASAVKVAPTVWYINGSGLT